MAHLPKAGGRYGDSHQFPTTPPDRDRALLGVQRAAVEVAAARRRLARAVDVAKAAGWSRDEIALREQAADGPLPEWMPPGGGPPSFAP